MSHRFTRFGDRTRRVLAGLMVLLVAVGSTSQFAAKSPEGLHCPTAPEQAVAVESEKTAVGQFRVPVPGDAEFKQCECAETRAERAEAAAENQISPTDAASIEPYELILPLEPLQEWKVGWHVKATEELPHPPPLPPSA